MSFNQNFDGVAPNCPCTKDCKKRNAYCRTDCEAYKEWCIIQKKYSNKVKWLRRKNGYGTPFNATRIK